MLNFRESEPMLRAFLEVGNSELAVSRPDPATVTSFETMGKSHSLAFIFKPIPILMCLISYAENIPALVAHLAYHFEVRCHLLSIHSIPHLLPTVENDLRVSIAAIDELAHKLRALNQKAGDYGVPPNRTS